MSDEDDDGDDWDFYPCVVDDRPASIFLNLRYEHTRPSSLADTLFWLRIHMLDPADNGMGSSAEGERCSLSKMRSLRTLRSSILCTWDDFGMMAHGS
jgi:hypothetical protein